MAIDWYERLGAKPPEGGQPESAASGGAEETPAAKEQQIADADLTEGGQPPEEIDDQELAVEQEAAEPAQENDKKPQSRKEREHFAAARRKAEMQQQLESFKTQLRQEMSTSLQQAKDGFVAQMGLTDPYTGERIKTQEQYEAMTAERLRREADQQLEGAGLNRELFEKLIENHPDVVEARRAADEAQKAKSQAAEATTSQRAQEQLEEIQKLDPGIKSLNDLLKLPGYPQMKAILQSQRDGEAAISIADAFFLVNRREIEQRKQAAAKQEAINLAKGKEHLSPIDPHSQQGGVTVPAEVAQRYRSFYPGITDAEILKKYQAVSGRK